jgi:O-antigen/teichoic acid export membrane protein
MAVVKLAPLEPSGNPDVIHRAAVQAKLLLSLACLGLVVLSAAPVAAIFLHDASRSGLIIASCLAAFLMLLLRSAQTQMQIDGRFKLYGAIDMLHFTGRFGGIALLLASGVDSALWFMTAFGAAALLPLLIWVSVSGKRLLHVRAGWSETRSVARTALWMGATFALGAVIARLDLLLLTQWSTLDQTGLFAAAQVFAIPMQLAGTYVAVVLSPRISPLLSEGRFYAFYCRVQAAILSVCAVITEVFLATWHTIAPAVLPPAYARSSDVAYLLVPGAIAGLATFPLTLAFVMFVRPKFLVLMDCVTLPVVIGLNWWAIPQYGAAGAAFVSTLASVVRAGIAQIQSWRWAKESSSGPAVVCTVSTEIAVTAS